MKPYVYRTTDFGKTWTALAPADGSMKGYAHVVKEDPVDAKLLFVGTELGLWISLDGGKHWAQYKGGESAERRRARPRRPPARLVARHRDARARHLDRRRHHAAALPDRGHARARRGVRGRHSPSSSGIGAFGGWGNGDAAFEAPESLRRRPDRLLPEEAPHLRRPEDRGPRTGRQAPRRPLPTSKRRGLSRSSWSMRLKAPRVPPAATVGLRRQQRARASSPGPTRSG